MPKNEIVDHYSANYENFSSRLFAGIRAEAFGEDIGQNGWLTSEEQDLFISWLNPGASTRLLDVACGSGGPTLRIALKTGCYIHGIDLHERGIETACEQARARGLTKHAVFVRVDAGQPLPFPDESFDGVICVDAVNHLPDRPQVLREWARVLKGGGRLVFTDPITVTGPLSNEEIRIRSSIGFFLFVPEGANERMLVEAGFELAAKEDRTENMARIAGRWHAAREARANELIRVEGQETFEGQQAFFRVAAGLASERRLSRFAYCAIRI
jgi:ubiquinone/menaquinone biosynthesis C-methylase UbiE